MNTGLQLSEIVKIQKAVARCNLTFNGSLLLNWDESEHPRDHGKFSSSGGGNRNESHYAEHERSLGGQIKEFARDEAISAGVHHGSKKLLGVATARVLGTGKAIKTTADAAKVGTALVGVSRWARIVGSIGTIAKYGAYASSFLLQPEIAIPLAIASVVCWFLVKNHKAGVEIQRRESHERDIMNHERELMRRGL